MTYIFQIGISVASIDGVLLVMGGGAVCFSFGTYWNKGCYTLDLSDNFCEKQTKFHYKETRLPVADDRRPLAERSSPRAAIPVPRIKLQSPDEFDKVLASNKPIILEGMDIGCCLEKWSTAYLKQKIGPLKEVSDSFEYSVSTDLLIPPGHCSRSFISAHEF